MTSTAPPKILVICGPTASGKSELAVRLAQELEGEIVNADSMQIYRGMDIGTAKPAYGERDGIPHHLLDVADPDQPFSAADFSAAASHIISDITGRAKRPIVVGGTGLYIRALLHGLVDSPSGAGEVRRELQAEAQERGNQAMLEQLRTVDPELASGIHPNNLVRIIRGLEVYRLTGIPLSHFQREHGFSQQRYRCLQIGIHVERQELYDRIEKRVERMLSMGLLDEVQELLMNGFGPELKAMRSIGYRETCSFLAGEQSLEETTLLIKRNSRRYAKRQSTWFNADPNIIWLEYPEKFATILRHCIEFF
ncbi:MAG: tRNA (adenosine(37)-N6)-dimethylallyltransferase MiaA [Desulfuromonadales bacterium]|nr:tRNA (adenosine(37)-N6)-dimethylallyltransferase MiaA [Desulfuromonadales bacterium]